MYEKQFLTPINAADRPRPFLWKHVLNKMELTFAIELTLTFNTQDFNKKFQITIKMNVIKNSLAYPGI